MASPLKSIGNFLFGGGGNSNQMMPFMLPQLNQPPMPPPASSPAGSPSDYKKGPASFISAAAPPPQPGNLANKTLLGQ